MSTFNATITLTNVGTRGIRYEQRPANISCRLSSSFDSPNTARRICDGTVKALNLADSVDKRLKSRQSDRRLSLLKSIRKPR